MKYALYVGSWLRTTSLDNFHSECPRSPGRGPASKNLSSWRTSQPLRERLGIFVEGVTMPIGRPNNLIPEVPYRAWPTIWSSDHSTTFVKAKQSVAIVDFSGCERNNQNNEANRMS
jgi:hypothetical protein